MGHLYSREIAGRPFFQKEENSEYLARLHQRGIRTFHDYADDIVAWQSDRANYARPRTSTQVRSETHNLTVGRQVSANAMHMLNAYKSALFGGKLEPRKGPSRDGINQYTQSASAQAAKAVP